MSIVKIHIMREYDDPNKDPNKYGSHAYWEVANRRLLEQQEEEIAYIERLRKEAKDRERIAATFRQPSSASPSGSSQGSPLGLLILMGIVVAETWGSITNWAHGTWQTVSSAIVTHHPYKAAFLYYYYFFVDPFLNFFKGKRHFYPEIRAFLTRLCRSLPTAKKAAEWTTIIAKNISKL